MAEYVEEWGRFNHWTLTPKEFKKRYRLGKEPLGELCDDFWESKFCTNKTKRALKTQLGYDERVCRVFP